MKKTIKIIFLLFLHLALSISYAKEIDNDEFTSDDIYAIKNVHSIDLSSSANKITYIETFANKKNDIYENSLWLHDIKRKNSKRLIKSIKSISAPQFSPNEKYIAYISSGNTSSFDLRA